MSTKYLGQPFDIHGGGRDLIFPHHENEIAQSEGAFAKPLAVSGCIMDFSISTNKRCPNRREIFLPSARFSKTSTRWRCAIYFLSSHYRSPMEFSTEGLEEAGRAIDRIYDTLDRLTRALPGHGQAPADAALMEAFRREMDDDFNTPRALALIFEEVRSLNRLLDEKKTQGLASRAAALRTICDAIGLLHEVYFERKKERWLKKSSMTRAEIDALIAQRNSARQAKNWLEADRLRDELQRKGIAIEDLPGGTLWKVK